MAPLMECVPNVSEGRDLGIIGALARAVEMAGARLVDVHSDVDHHRSVFTFFGEPSVVERAALALGCAAIERIDLSRHHGIHPRIGALDVMPFVPLAGSSMADAVRCAHAVGRTLAAETGIPVFFYGHAAVLPDRRELPRVRSGGFERLAARLADPAWRPDAGPAGVHPTAGAAVIGARGPLIAFNAVLESSDLSIAQGIARAIRESSGGLPAVRAMGVLLRSRRLVQVSMNLLNYCRTPVHVVAERLEYESALRGVRVLEYELVGCAPADAFEVPLNQPIAGLKRSQLLDPGLFPRDRLRA